MAKCKTCENEALSDNVTWCYRCASKYYDDREKEYPFVVRMGNGDFEEFKTMPEAQKFLDEIKRSYIETRNN